MCARVASPISVALGRVTLAAYQPTQQLPQLSDGSHWPPHDGGQITPAPAAQPLVQVASQAHELAQLMPPPQPEPVQLALHAPSPQMIPEPHPEFVHDAVQSPAPVQLMPPPHVVDAEHAIVHDASLHATPLPHVVDALQSTLHSLPPLHATPLVQVFEALHWMSQRFAVHRIGAVQSPP